MYVPQFGWLTDAPRIRVATTLPNSTLFDLAFDFTFSQTTKTFSAGSEQLNMTIPAITGEFALGSALHIMRTKQLLGGVYLGAGAAPVFLQDSLRSYNVQSTSSTLGSSNVRCWMALPGPGQQLGHHGLLP